MASTENSLEINTFFVEIDTKQMISQADKELQKVHIAFQMVLSYHFQIMPWKVFVILPIHCASCYNTHKNTVLLSWEDATYNNEETIYRKMHHMIPHGLFIKRCTLEYERNYHKISNIRCTESPSLNVSRLVLQLPLPNPMKPGVQSRMKM